MAKAAVYLLVLISLAFCLGDVSAGGVSTAGLLFDQLQTPFAAGVLSEQFADVGGLHFLAADDFVVPTGQTWQVQNVSIRGIFQTSKSAEDESGAIWNVRIYNAIGGKLTETMPGPTPAFEFLTIQATLNEAAGNDTFGQIDIPLANPPLLSAGTYWISVFPTKTGRSFFWQVTQNGNMDPFLINQENGLNICTDITATEASKWTLPFRCPQAFFFENNDTSADINSFTGLVFRLRGEVNGISATTGTTGNANTGAVVTTGGTGVVVTTGQSGGVVVTTGNTAAQVTTQGIVVTSSGNVGSVNFGSSASTLSAFWRFW